jgi:hypothetical protein
MRQPILRSGKCPIHGAYVGHCEYCHNRGQGRAFTFVKATNLPEDEEQGTVIEASLKQAQRSPAKKPGKSSHFLFRQAKPAPGGEL